MQVGSRPSRPPFACFCGEAFDLREALVDHNTLQHGMSEPESRSLVHQRYPLES